MIVSRLNDRLLLISQNDHAHFAAELLSLWHQDGLPSHPRREDLLFAAREHDNGWREVDSAPMCQQNGAPHDFRSVPAATRQQLWQRGIERFADARPYAALLINRHALNLHQRRRGHSEWQPTLDAWSALEEQWLIETESTASQVADDYRWIDLLDTLSLAVCERWPKPFESRVFQGSVHVRSPLAIDLELRPFPLAGSTAFSLPCRQIEERVFSGDADLAVELACARWQAVTVRVVPG